MLTEIATGVYVEDAYPNGAVGLVASQLGNLLIDVPMLPSAVRDWRLQMMQLNDAPIYGVANTDYHAERYLGNAYLGGVRSFGHTASNKPVARYEGQMLEQLAGTVRDTAPAQAEEILHTQVRPPEVCVDDRLTLHLGDRRVTILALEGHTPASLGVFLEEERILFAGDNITCQEHPVMYQANTAAWLSTLDRIRTMDVETIVAGGGQLCDKSVIDPLYGYIAEMHRRVSELFDKGASRRECVDKVGMLDWFPFAEEQAAAMRKRRRGNVERVYTEIRISRKRKR